MLFRTCLSAAILALLGLTACASVPQEGFDPIPRAQAPVFDPILFFAGRSEGRGMLSKVGGGTVPVRVESVGEVSPLGVLVLTQTVYEGDAPPRIRTWTMERLGEGYYSGRLTDAYGLVEGWSRGNMLTLTYTMHGNYEVTQRLTLAPDGQRAYNRMRVQLMGATIAELAEEIVRAGPGPDPEAAR